MLALAVVPFAAPLCVVHGAAAVEPQAPALLVDRATAGQNQPAAGRSLFQRLFSEGVPFPFSRLLDGLRQEAGADNVTTALVPLGRSLQRYSAHPRYFASPRVVVAVTGDRAAGPGTSRLADRLYVGYQPAAEVMEVLSYNEEAGRFEFQEIVGYAADRRREIRQAERRVCLACHQGHAPIFTRPLWSETNANPAVADRLAALGEVFHGAPVRQSIDALARFNASTDRAARIALANRLWSDACPDARCRAGLLLKALQFGLNGSRPEWNAQDPQAVAFAVSAAALWPSGLASPSPSLTNRDPMVLVSTMRPEQIIETKGDLNPETPRPLEVLWKPGPNALSSAAREIAAEFAAADFVWLDAQLRRVAKASETVHELACKNATLVRPDGAQEFRFNCTNAGQSLNGFLTRKGDAWQGRIDEMRVADTTALRNLAIQSQVTGETLQLEATLVSAGMTLSARLDDGRRIGRVEMRSPESPEPGLRFVLGNDLLLLATRLAASAEADDLRLGKQLRRHQLLELLASLLEG